MTRRLVITKLNEVHFVDKGGAVNARVLIAKRDADIGANPERSMDPKFVADFAKSWFDSFKKAEAAGLALGDPEKLLEQALTSVKDEATKGAIMAAVAALFRSAPPKPAEKDVPSTEDVAMSAAPTPPAPPKAPKEEPPAAPLGKSLDSIMKSASPEIKAVFEELAKSQEASKKEAEDLRKRFDAIEKERAEEISKRELTEEIEVAKRFPHVRGDIAKRAAMLHSIKKNQGKAVYDDLIETLASCQEIAKKALEKPVNGSSQNDENDKGGAYAKLKAAADELVSKSNGKLTYGKAVRQVAKDNPELYAAARHSAN
jgi:hypothetical protein